MACQIGSGKPPRDASLVWLALATACRDTLGIYLLLTVRKPSAHRSLIAFTAWSSVLHATVMAVQTMRGAIPRIDLLRAVLPMFVIGVALIVLAPVKQPEASAATVR
jgi:hypothetical protein